MPNAMMYDVLQKASSFEEVKDRVAYLQKNDSNSLRIVLKHMFDPKIKFLLPEGDPPYKPSNMDEPGPLYNELRRLYLFVEGGHSTLSQVKRERLFIEVLEQVSADDAKIFLAMKDKTSPFKGLTKSVVTKAFPGLLD